MILAQLTCLVNHHSQLKQRTGRMTYTESTDSLAESRAELLGFGFIIIIIIRDNSPAYINMSPSTLSLIYVLKVRIKVQYRR